MSIFSTIFYYFRIYRSYIGHKLYLLFGITFLVAVSEGFGIALLLPLLKVSEVGMGQPDLNPKIQYLLDILEYVGIGSSLVGILLFIGLVFICKGCLKCAEVAYRGYLQAQLMRILKYKMFDYYATMEYTYYISRNIGHFINIINGQINRFIQSFLAFTEFLGVLVLSCGYFLMAFLLNWRFTVMAFVLGVGLLHGFKYISRYVATLSRKTSLEQTHLSKFLIQTLQSFKYLTATKRIEPLKKEIYQSIHRLTGYSFRTQAAQGFVQGIQEPVSILFLICIIIIQVSVLGQPIAPIFVTLILFHRGVQSAVKIQLAWQKAMKSVGGVEMTLEEFETVANRQESNGNTRLSPLQQGIELQNVSFAYDPKNGNVLHELNMKIPVNTIVALVGESGAGKSTLVDLLCLLLRPQHGQLFIDGVSNKEVELSSWRSQIGYVSQETVMFDDTIASNISLWSCEDEKDHISRKKIEAAAHKAYCQSFIKTLPDGYQTVVGDRGIKLSGGQRQRLFIARELFKEPKLLILDEATSSLDTESERYIQKSIDELKGKTTLIIIAHRLSTIKNADYIYVLDHGRIVEEGAYDELVCRQDSKFGRMVKMQSLEK